MSRPNNPDEIDLFEDGFYSNSNTEEPNEVEVDEDAAMAQTLGFTSFGATRPLNDDDSSAHPSKRRRFNPHLDNAVIAVNEEEPTLTAYRAQAHPHKRQKTSAAPGDEITYSDRDGYPDTNANNNDAAPPHGNTQRPHAGGRRRNYSPRGGNRGGGNRGGGNWGRGRGGGYNNYNNNYNNDNYNNQYNNYDSNYDGNYNSNYDSNYNNQHNNNNNQNHPNPNNNPNQSYNNNNNNNQNPNNNPSKPKPKPTPRSPLNPLWYIDYYDPASNENPWEGMERFKGLAAVGSWLVRFWGRGGAGEEGGTGEGGAGGDGVGGGASAGVKRGIEEVEDAEGVEGGEGGGEGAGAEGTYAAEYAGEQGEVAEGVDYSEEFDDFDEFEDVEGAAAFATLG